MGIIGMTPATAVHPGLTFIPCVVKYDFLTFGLIEPMPLVKMKDKGQVTIPAAVREQIHAAAGDVFDVVVDDGNIVLRPRDVVARKVMRSKMKAKGVDISRWIGAGKGLFKTPAEADAFIRNGRDQWD
jgi:AbrB family looped-hinge helix DNA binding protein